ncbi:MAG: OB-fold nucleic acid binding domain-containing protein [Thaumarchaeota archaeon]|nr:OB-fold nucleic acid binding domain-containing protein [Candidatus Calditenuaceae archaeon]MDW8187410.1 OB-fold nucleic acid binding domain-containing protein [Nitrososphaerota archaeon]
MSRVERIENLSPSSRGVNLVAKIVSKSEPRVVSSQYDDANHKLSIATIADESGAISLVLWDDDIDKVEVGSTVKITNAYVKVFKGKMQLNLGRYGSIEPVSEDIGDVNVENNLSEKTVPAGGFFNPSRSRAPRRRPGRFKTEL